MWVAECSCGFEETSSNVYDLYWDEEKEECMCPDCDSVLSVERW